MSGNSEPPWLSNWKAAQAAGDVLPDPQGRRPDGTLQAGVSPCRPAASGVPAGIVSHGPSSAQLATVQATLDAGAADVAAAMVARAKGGCAFSAKLILDRVAPVRKPKAEATPFILDASKPVAVQCAQVAQAMAEGTLTAEQAEQVATVLERLASLAHTDSLEARLQALERVRAAETKRIAGGVLFEDPSDDAVQTLFPSETKQ